MKTKMLLIYFAFFQLNLYANDSYFAPIGAKWHYGIVSSNFFIDKYYRTFEVIKDTIIEEKQCSVLEQTEYFRKEEGGYISGYEYIYSDDQKVYRWNKSKSQFYLLYDFTANVGDSWRVPCVGCGGQSSDSTLLIRVDAVNHINLSGKQLKQLTVTSDGASSFGIGQVNIIERIGGSGYLFLFGYAWEDMHIPNLRCYSDFEISGSFSNEACDLYVTHISNVQNMESSLNIYDGCIQFPKVLLANLVEVSVYDVSGKLALKAMPNDDGILTIQSLSRGIYIVVSKTNNFETKTFKFCK